MQTTTPLTQNQNLPQTNSRTFCPRCGSPLAWATSISGAPSTDWLTCTNKTCNTYVDTYRPMPHQASVHKDTHRIIGNFGSYGTGKTKTSEKEIEKHIFLTPNANILLGANVMSQYEQTLLRDFEKSFPEAFLDYRSIQKAYLDFLNGARLMLRPFDDPDKLRSNNYSMVVMLEASEIQAEAYHQLKTRLRNTAASITDPETNTTYDWRKMIVESNPDSGWIRTDVLLVSDAIYKHGKFAQDNYDQTGLALDSSISTHVASTDVNHFLPPDYIEVNSKNKPDWWIRRFIHGSFLFAEGLVYPSAMKCVVPTPLNRTPDPKWKIIIAHDYGLMDTATFVFGGIDEERGKLIIYKDVRTNEMSVQNLANLFKENVKDINFGQLYTTPIIDPKNNKRDYDKKDLITHYSEYGISFQPGYINIDARIFRLNDYFEQGRIEIWDCCTGLIEELREYKFKPKTLNDRKNDNKPIDKNNHSINPLEWIVMELPADPKKLYIAGYNSKGVPLDALDKSYNTGGWQLSNKSYEEYIEEEESEDTDLNYMSQADDELTNYQGYDNELAFGIEGGF